MEREMRLTKDLRERFVDSVMAGTKCKAEEAEAACIAACNKELYMSLPEDVRRLDKKYPGLMARYEHCVDLPTIGKYTYAYLTVTALNKGKADSYRDHLTAERQAVKDEEEARKDLRRHLMSVAAGCRTAEELAKKLPELSSYIPRETRPLAVTTHAQLITDLMNVGLDLETPAA